MRRWHPSSRRERAEPRPDYPEHWKSLIRTQFNLERESSATSVDLASPAGPVGRVPLNVLKPGKRAMHGFAMTRDRRTIVPPGVRLVDVASICNAVKRLLL